MAFTFLANNLAVMLAMGLFYGFLIRRRPDRLIYWQVICGVFFGLAAIVTMKNSYELHPGAIFDCRSVILSVAGMFAGPVTALIAVCFAAAYRLWQGGVGALTGILVIISTAAVGVVFHYLRQARPWLAKPLWLYVFGILVHGVMLLLMLTFPWPIALNVLKAISLPVIILYPFGTALLGKIFVDQENSLTMEQKLRAFNQQLQAGEQQLRAANQQLQASEQQLRAANQQLRASESQLKVSNERLQDVNDKLSSSMERFRLLMEQSPSVIEIYDRNGLQIAVNEAYEELWGFPRSHTLYQFNLFKSEEVKRKGLLDYVRKALAGQPVTVPEYQFDSTGPTEGRGIGRKRWLYTRIYPLKDSTGNVENIVITHEDITERKQAEREREKLVRMLRTKNEELQSIVYVASHDLKSPLVNISGFGKLLTSHCSLLKASLADAAISETAKKLIDEDIPEDMEFILQGTDKMNALINGLLEVSRAGTMAMQMIPLNMTEMFNSIIDNVSYKTQQVKAEITVDPLAPCIGDAMQINRVFTNLVENALKYTDPSRAPRIHISSTVHGAESVYCVEDNGIGIDPAYHTKIFEIFHRLDPHHTVEGEGLGLTIVRRILDRHNGKIWIESAPGKGSKFFVALSHQEVL